MIYAILFVILGVLLLVIGARARLKQRAQFLFLQNKKIKKAHAIQNDIVRDDDERQRVREHFNAS